MSSILDVFAEFLQADLPANGHSLALEAARLVITGQTFLVSFTVLNTNASAQYIQLHDVSVAPSSGAIPQVVYAVAGATTLVISYALPGRRFHQGVYITNSSTAATLTAGAADCFYDVQTIPGGLL